MIDVIVAELRRTADMLAVADGSALARALYDILHLRRAPASSGRSALASTFSARELFGHITRHEEGWRAVTRPGVGSLIFERAGLRLRVDPPDIVADGVLALPAIRDRLSPGFAGLLSPSEPPDHGVRVYVPVARDAAPEAGRVLASVVGAVTTRYVIKGLSVGAEYPRPDAFTVYVSRDDLEALLDALGDCGVERYLTASRQTSLFAKPHESGVSWIEGPARDSAGQVRAACVARALHWHRSEPRASLAAAVERELVAAGIDARMPYKVLSGVSDAA